MSRSLLPPTLAAFFNGHPLKPVGYRRDGRPIFAIAGAAEDDAPPERPDDVPEADWDALGDPGKKALTREREKNADLQRQLTAAKARPTPPKPPAAPAAPESSTDRTATDTPDIAKLVQEGIAAAMKPFQEAEQERAATAAANTVRNAVIDAAKDRLHDGTDGLMIDLVSVVDDAGKPDAAKITAAIDDLVKAKPHLAKDTRRFAAPGVGPTPGGATPPIKEQVQGLLAQMQSAGGVRVPSNS